MQKRNLIAVILLLLGLTLGAQQLPPALQEFANGIARQSGFAPVGGNSLWTTKNGEAFLERLLLDIDAAQNSIELEYYWIAPDKAGTILQEALVQKALQGVQVRVLTDNLIAPGAPESFFDKMRKAGADVRFVHEFSKMGAWKSVSSIMGYRDHRKIVVIDGSITYTGGINFCNHAIYEWKDSQLRLEGPAAMQLRALFESSWTAAGGAPLEPIAAAPAGNAVAQAVGSDGKDHLENLYIHALQCAKEYFYIQTPYFAPPPAVLDALKQCAARGVEVCILLPEECDWGFMNSLTRDYFPELMEAGIRIFIHSGVYDHTKSFVSDNSLACCGTVNMDYRSLRTNWEDAFLFYDYPSASYFRSLFLQEARKSQELQPGSFTPAKGLKKAYNKFLRKLAPNF